MIPFLGFLRPCILCYPLWGDNQSGPRLQAVIQNNVQGGEGGYCLANPFP